MNNTHERIHDLERQLSQQEAQIQQLREENQQLHSDLLAAQTPLASQTDLEERSENSDSRFETIFNQSTLGNKIIDSNLTIIQVNKVLVNLLGYSAQELIGTRIITYAHPDFVEHWKQMQKELWTNKIPSFQIETCLIKKDGRGCWCQIRSVLFQDKEETLGFTSVEDISERKALEVNLKKLYDHQETIIHMVAHDLRSPLNNIQSLNGILKKKLDAPLLVAAQQVQSLPLIQMIADTCAKALTTVKDLLLIGEMASPVTFEKINLRGYLEPQLSILGIDAHKKGIDVQFQADQIPMYTSINQDKFTRLLENLLSNAVKFTNPGGKITLSLSKTGHHILLKVSDTGIGIPAHLQASIFNKFTKAKRKGTQGENTTGLGLYIVKQIVDLHQGTIWVESKENVGTSFFIQLNSID